MADESKDRSTETDNNDQKPEDQTITQPSNLRRPFSLLQSTDLIQCKHCGRNIVTESSDGLVPCGSATEGQPCAMCEGFQDKYNAMLAADAKYDSFHGRRDTYGPKVEALTEMRKARIGLKNWLIEIESEAKAAAGTPRSRNSPFDTSEHEDRKQHGTKRAFLDSPLPKKTVLEVRPNVARCDSTASLPERKRIKFSDSVEFRDDYRPCEAYSRSEKSYMPGRHAAPEDSRYLDTSGSKMSFFSFTGFKKVGKEWVDMWKDDDNREQSTKSRKMKDSGVIESKYPGPISKTSETQHGINALVLQNKDIRPRRLTRRSNVILSAPVARQGSADEAQDEREDANVSREITLLERKYVQTTEGVRDHPLAAESPSASAEERPTSKSDVEVLHAA